MIERRFYPPEDTPARSGSSALPNLPETLALIDATTSLIDIATAMLCQPRFGNTEALNPAGRELQEMVFGLEARRDDLLAALGSLPARTPWERGQRLATLLRFEVEAIVTDADAQDLLASARTHLS